MATCLLVFNLRRFFANYLINSFVSFTVGLDSLCTVSGQNCIILLINKNKTELQINLIANATRELFIFLKQNLIFSVVMVPPFLMFLKKKFFFLLQPSCPNGYICHHGHCDIGMSYLIFIYLDISNINIYLYN